MDNKKLKKFLHRHNQLLTVIGALIVFCAFIVNDVLRERLKDMASAIASTQNFLAIRSDIRAIRSELDPTKTLLIEKRPQWIPKDQLPRSTGNPREDQIRAFEFDQRRTAIDTGFHLRLGEIDSFYRVSNLARSMQREEEINAEIQSLVEEEKMLNKELYDRLAKLSKETEWDRFREAERRLGESQTKANQWVDKVDKFTFGVVVEAAKTRDRSERNYKIYTRVSYLLYFLGWALALVGKLGGVEAALGHE